MYQKAVLHLDLDCFFVECERLHNTKLKDKPVIVGGNSRRGVVASCSYEARLFGIRSGMPMYIALQRCPDAIVIKGDFEDYASQSSIVREIIVEQSPLVEVASIDEFYVDMSGMDRYVGCELWSKELRQRIIKETGLPISAGLSINKTVSKITTTEAKPNNFHAVQTGLEKAYIAPLSTAKIPSIGTETYQRLSVRGVRNIGKLSTIPPKLLIRSFGKHGLSMWKKANAIDDAPVIPFHQQKSISMQRTFQQDSIDIAGMKGKLTRMVMDKAFELRNKQKLTSCIEISIRYNDFKTYTKQQKIPYTAHDQSLIKYAHQLFDKLYNRRVSVRRLGVKFSGLVYGCPQIQLFEDTQSEIALLQSMDKIRQRFGQSVIGRATTLKKKH